MSLKEHLLLVGLGAALCLGGLSLYAHRQFTARQETVLETVEVPFSPPARPAPQEPAATLPLRPAPSPGAAPVVTSPVVVSVVGAVQRPDVYEFSYEARVQDLLEAAGGPRLDADLDDINLAARLIDGSTLAVPARAPASRDGTAKKANQNDSNAAHNPPQYTVSGWRPQGPGDPTTARSATVPGGLIDVNRASLSELETLPGIGPKLGADIIRYRSHTPFRSVGDLDDVPGIGTKRLEAIRPFVTVGGA